jgi:hypothetical protein
VRSGALKVGAGLLGIAALVVWLTSIFFYTRYYEMLPRHLDAATGHVRPYNYHGIVIYLTVEQERRQAVLMWTAGALAVVAVGLDLVRRRGRPKPPVWLPAGMREEPLASNDQAADERRHEVRK